MKKIILSIILSLSFYLTYSQSENTISNAFGFLSEEIFIEGNLQFSMVNNQNFEDKTTDFTANPKVGYFLTDNFAVGLQGNYKLEKYTAQDISSDIKMNTYAGGIFGRYYFLELGKRFFTYAEIGGTYGLIEGTITDLSKDTSSDLDGVNTINSGLSLGMNYFVNKNILISFTLSDLVTYNYKKSKANGSKPTESINADVNIINNFFQTAQFGVMFLL